MLYLYKAKMKIDGVHELVAIKAMKGRKSWFLNALYLNMLY